MQGCKHESIIEKSFVLSDVFGSHGSGLLQAAARRWKRQNCTERCQNQTITVKPQLNDIKYQNFFA